MVLNGKLEMAKKQNEQPPKKRVEENEAAKMEIPYFKNGCKPIKVPFFVDMVPDHGQIVKRKHFTEINRSKYKNTFFGYRYTFA